MTVRTSAKSKLVKPGRVINLGFGEDTNRQHFCAAAGATRAEIISELLSIFYPDLGKIINIGRLYILRVIWKRLWIKYKTATRKYLCVKRTIVEVVLVHLGGNNHTILR